MKKIIVLLLILNCSFVFASPPPVTAVREGKLTYGKMSASLALMAIEGDAAATIYDDMISIQVQQIQKLQVKVGKSVTCLRGWEVVSWKTTCYMGFTDLTNGSIDNAQVHLRH